MQGRRPCTVTRVAAPPHLSAYYAMLWLLWFVITQPNIPEEQVAYRQCTRPFPLPRRRGSARLHVYTYSRRQVKRGSLKFKGHRKLRVAGSAGSKSNAKLIIRCSASFCGVNLSEVNTDLLVQRQ